MGQLLEAESEGKGEEERPLFNFYVYLFIWQCWVLFVTCGIFRCRMWTFGCGIWELLPWLGLEPGLPALGEWGLSHWTVRAVPRLYLLSLSFLPVQEMVSWSQYLLNLRLFKKQCFFKKILFSFNWRIIALQYCIDFTIHQHESAIDIHMSLPPTPSHPLGHHRVPVWVPWVIQQIPTGYLFHIWWCICFHATLSVHPTLSSPHRVRKSILYIRHNLDSVLAPRLRL